MAHVAPYCDPPSPPDGDPCPCAESPPAPGLPVVRNRYFTGKYMTARDFRDEQEYFLARQRLHLRALHGWGVVCGLELEEHPDPDCRARGWVVVTPGIAVDCHGREIVLTERTPAYLPGLLNADVAPGEEPDGGGYDPKTNKWCTAGRPPDNDDFLFGVRYAELCVEPVPVLLDEAGCRSRTTPNRIREQPVFRFYKYEKDAGCWLPAGPGCASYPPNPGSDFAAGCGHPTPDDCFQPLCPCGPGGFVPLARFNIRRQPDGTVRDANEKNPRPPKWDVSGRRFLFGPLHPFTLTHICQVNWEHGGTTDVKALHGNGESIETGWARLTITFDRPLCEALPSAEGPGWLAKESGKFPRPWLYDNVLRVGFEHQSFGTLPLTGPDHRRYRLSADRKQLHYEFETSHVNDQLRTCGAVIIRVALNCDFLPDEYGRAVDGNHLRGSLGGDPRRRTGDGVEGGVFESWFRLTGLNKQEALP